MNRVAAKIEKFGEWNLSLLDEESFTEVTDFDQIENAKAKGVIGRAIQSSNLTQGIWNHWSFSKHECRLLQDSLENKVATFRVDGPKHLPPGEDSQMMQFDIGYGKFGGGIQYRPILDIKYTLKKKKIKLTPVTRKTICTNKTQEGLKAGFDPEGNKVYAYMDFDLSQLPDPENTMITACALRISAQNTFKKRSDIRYYVELVDVDEVGSYDDIRNREQIEYIGYEVAESDLKKNECQYFNFDTFSKNVLDELHQGGKALKLVIKPTSANGAKDRTIIWNDDVELIVSYIPKRRTPLATVKNLQIKKENKMIKLTWDDIEDEALNGYYVVRNTFHTPKHFMDGVKIYGGKDTWTYDNFASFDKEKHYAVFSYDDVPNFSEPATIKYNPLEKY